MPFVQTDSTVTTIFAGVNDVNTHRRGARRRRRRQQPAGVHRRAGQRVRHRLRDAHRRHPRARAAGAHRRRSTCPNVAGLPYLAGASLDAAPGAAARVGRDHDDRRQCAHVARRHRRRSDVRCAVVPAVELLVRRFPSERRRLRVHRVGGRQRHHVSVVPGAAEQLSGDDDRPVDADRRDRHGVEWAQPALTPHVSVYGFRSAFASCRVPFPP